MQHTETLEISKLPEIVNAIFQETAVAYEDYSAYDSNLKKYESLESVLKAIQEAIDSERKSVNFAVYYPDAKGYLFEEKKSLNPEKCNGATFRYVASGWGLVHLQIDLRNMLLPKVRITVNSEKRANAWAATCPEFQDPCKWDWKYIESQARRVIRVLKKCA